MKRRSFAVSMAALGVSSLAGCSRLSSDSESMNDTTPTEGGPEGPIDTDVDYGTPVPTTVDIAGPHERPLTQLLDFYNDYLQADTAKMQAHLHTPRMSFTGDWRNSFPDVSVDSEVTALNARYFGSPTMTEQNLVRIAAENSDQRLTEPEARQIARTETRVYTVAPETSSPVSPNSNRQARYFNNVLKGNDWILSLQDNTWKVI